MPDSPTEASGARRVAVVGGGPAGLRAAEVAAQLGAEVTLYDGMRSVGRKFLIAGKSGLNLTNAEAFDGLLARYAGENLPAELWREMFEEFDADALRAWAAELGIETFVGKGGRVLPKPQAGRMRSTPLLRVWIARLRERGVDFQLGQRWTGFGANGALRFLHEGEEHEVQPDASVLALGGASWPKTGSDGTWASILEAQGVNVRPLSPSNCGWEVDWPPELLAAAEGLPLKNLCLHADDLAQRGELVITRYGLEGGPIYRAGPVLRAMQEPAVRLDFKPDSSHADLLARFGDVKRHFVREARRRLNLDAGTCALLKHLPARGPWKTPRDIVDEIKSCQIPLRGPRPVPEAISTAGGIAWEELDAGLMLRRIPNVHVAGEMIDWDAPTGGYLLQACFATGTRAGRSAAQGK